MLGMYMAYWICHVTTINAGHMANMHAWQLLSHSFPMSLFFAEKKLGVDCAKFGIFTGWRGLPLPCTYKYNVDLSQRPYMYMHTANTVLSLYLPTFSEI